MTVEKAVFGRMDDGREVEAYTLSNETGMQVKITTYGGALMQIITPDREGKSADVICGYDTLADYCRADGYQGALIGRWGNRIGGARFTMDGEEYCVGANEGGINLLHGGFRGFNTKLWQAEVGEDFLTLNTFSPHGEEGFPGNLLVTVTYTLTEDNRLILDYRAEADRKTVINLTNHAYFNLGGYAAGPIFDHTLWLDADTYLETDETLIPTGRLIPVEGTPFDFRTPKALGRDIGADNRDLRMAGGYDHCFNLTGGASETLVLRGELYDSHSGRVMQIFTDRPCIQLYTGNVMTEPVPFKGGYPQQKYHAVCLETQSMPDSVHHQNEEDFTDCILRPGEIYDYTTVYKFSAE